MDELTHQWQHQGRTITFTWAGDTSAPPARVYALAFTPEGRMLLVGGPGDPGYWLPGGGIEAGETPAAGLIRELLEEAAATVHALERIGAQRVEDTLGMSEYHAFYWCRVTLADVYHPMHEVAQRRLVPPEAFLDALFWGRDDPKAVLLLERALECERRYGASHRQSEGRPS